MPYVVHAQIAPAASPGPVQDAAAQDRQARARGAPAAGQVQALWSTVAEADLLASSHERKFLAFKLFTRLLPSTTCAPAPVLA